MRNLLYYVAMFVISVTMSLPAKANDLLPHLEGKKLVYVGVCYFDKNGVLTFVDSEKKVVVKCAVGMALPDETKHYIIIYLNEKPAKLVMYDEKTKKQVTLWSGAAL